MAALAFLTEVGRADEFVLLSDVTRTSVLIDALSHAGDEAGATASDVEGPLYATTRRARGARRRSTRSTRGWATATCCSSRGARDLGGGGPLPEAVVDVWQTGPERRLRHLGRAPAGVQLPRALSAPSAEARYEFQTMLPKPYTVPTDGPVGRYLEAVGQHPWRPAHIHFKVTAPRPPAARDAGLLPRRPVPGERHDRRGQARAGAAGRAPRATHLGCDFDIALRAGGVSRFASCAARRAAVRGARRGRRVRCRCAASPSWARHAGGACWRTRR